VGAADEPRDVATAAIGRIRHQCRRRRHREEIKTLLATIPRRNVALDHFDAAIAQRAGDIAVASAWLPDRRRQRFSLGKTLRRLDRRLVVVVFEARVGLARTPENVRYGCHDASRVHSRT